jgi:hypothetical protein
MMLLYPSKERCWKSSNQLTRLSLNVCIFAEQNETDCRSKELAVVRKSWSVLKPGGRLVTIAADSAAASDDRTKQAFLLVKPN